MSTNYIDQITDTGGTTHDISEGDSTRIFRATCSTAAGTTAKVATLQTSSRNFSLATGVRVAVTFTYGNSATTPTLNVNSTGAKTIAVATSATAKATGNGTTYNTWGPYETVLFTYDGTYWVNEGSSLSIYNSYNYNNLSNKPTLFSGNYNDLTNKPTIPTLPSNIVNTITTTEGAHTVITSKTGDVSFKVPTKTSHLTNDSGFITSADLPSFVSGVKGNSESSYRTGNVNLTPANIGAVPTSRTVNSKALSSNITLTASDVSALANSGGQVSGDITLYKASGDSPSLIFQRGTLTDDYNDWRIYNTGGYLHFQQRGQNSTSWTDIAYIGSNGVIYGNGSGLSGIPTVGDTAWSTLETNFNYVKRSGIVFVDFYKTNQSLSTSWTTIGTLPSGYRPNHNLYGAAMSLGTPQIAYFINSSSGVVQMRTNSGSGSYVTALSVAYPVL